jgi:enamine deaminase RidA (YjgF/YER057c/UK114 family)|tara:strand:- start:857 stop:1339 length:483 start_codon:yes stop_codon:yes gene_type:complete
MKDTKILTPEERLDELGYKLPSLPPAPIGNFINTKRVGNLIYISGQGPLTLSGELKKGKVGQDVTIEEATEHAEIVAINIIASLKYELSSLSKVKSFVKLFGMVNSVPLFENHPSVINGCSDLLCKVFGEKGVHTRSAIGVGSLPNNITVEIEAIVEFID